MYLIILNIHGNKYYLGKGIWQGLKDNADRFTEIQARQIVHRFKMRNPTHDYTTHPTLKSYTNN
jgi:hypothetical protein